MNISLSLTEILAILSPIVSIAIACGVTNQRIKQLEKTVDKHNKFAERMPAVEARLDAVDKEIDDLKKEVK